VLVRAKVQQRKLPEKRSVSAKPNIRRERLPLVTLIRFLCGMGAGKPQLFIGHQQWGFRDSASLQFAKKKTG